MRLDALSNISRPVEVEIVGKSHAFCRSSFGTELLGGARDEEVGPGGISRLVVAVVAVGHPVHREPGQRMRRDVFDLDPLTEDSAAVTERGAVLLGGHHGVDPFGVCFGSRGSPRPRSPMMLRWISSVPPAMRWLWTPSTIPVHA